MVNCGESFWGNIDIAGPNGKAVTKIMFEDMKAFFDYIYNARVSENIIDFDGKYSDSSGYTISREGIKNIAKTLYEYSQ